MNTYYFTRKKYPQEPQWKGVDRDLLAKCSYAFEIDNEYNIQCTKDRDAKWGTYTMAYDHETRLTKRQRKFLCEVLLEWNTNNELQGFMNDVTVTHVCTNLVRGCYDSNEKVRLNAIRRCILDMNYKEFIGV